MKMLNRYWIQTCLCSIDADSESDQTPPSLFSGIQNNALNALVSHGQLDGLNQLLLDRRFRPLLYASIF